MADSFSPATGADQSVPTGQDKYDVAPPNYRQIGQALAAGQADYAAQTKAAKTGLSDFIAHPLDTLLTWAAEFLAWLLSMLLCVVAFIMRLVTSIDDGAAPGMAAVVKNSLGHVFGLPTGSTGRKVAAGVDGNAMGAQIGTMILNAMKSGAPASAGKPLQPDDTAAKNFLAMLARLGVEGWIDGFVAEAIGGGHLASVLELVPIMNEVLGLGRLSRRALAPLVKILVADPYTWKLHLDYRPALMPDGLAVREFIRGNLTAAQLDNALGKHGYSPDVIAALVNHHRKGISQPDLEYLVARGYWSTDRFDQALKDDGYDESSRLTLKNLPEQRLLDQLAEKRMQLFIQAYERGDVDDAEMENEVNSHSFTDPVKLQILDLARTHRLHAVKHLTLGEVQTMIKAHVMNLDDLRTWMTRENYPVEEQSLLEIYLMGQITTADEAAGAKRQKAQDAKTAAAARVAKQQQAAADAAAKAATKGLSIATFESLVENHLRSFDEFTAFLKELSIPPASITALVELLHEKINTKEATEAAHEALAAAAAIKHLPLSQIEAAVIAGTIPISDLAQFMTQQKFAQTDIDTALTYVQGKLDDATAKAAAAEAAKAAAAVKGISLPNLERAARLGLVAPADYSAALTSAGFDAHSVDLMAGILSSQMAADQHTIEQRAAAAAAAAKKNISLPALEKAVIAGLQPMGAYQAQLVALGYDAGDVATLVGLLQLQVDTAADVAAKKAAAAAKLGVKNLSLAEIERAVRLGVLSVDQYRADLAGIGFAPADVAILAASILAELAATKAAEAKQAAIAAALKNKGVSLAQEQQLVKDGISTLDAYTAFLRTQGYSDTVAAQLTQLLGDQMDQAALAAQKHADAAARAAEKNISLASEEKAVVDGIRTLDDYDALLVNLGFNETDQATLIALLELRLPAPEVPAA
jgi:hypothetical protein